MTASAGYDVTGSAFVGREHEMGALRAALVEAGAGRGRLILLAGEPGIGKTRTAEELASWASHGGAEVVWGRCYEGEGAPAFWPWVQVVRAVIKSLDADGVRAAIGSGGPIIAQIVPQIRESLPDLPLAAGVDSGEVRFLLFDSIVKFLGQASRRAPLVVILDDLQGADEPSLRLLQFVVRELRQMPVLLVGTFRDVALTPEQPLTATLAEVLRESSTQRLVLTGLSMPEVGRFIEATAGVSADAAVMAAVHGRTGGNPLFVTELVRVLFAEGLLGRSAHVIRAPMTIPAGVRAVIHRRLAPLSAECNAVLSAGSVIGRELRFDVLDAIAGMPWLVLLNALQEAVSARVLMDVPGASLRYRFTHALIRETLYEELGAARRIALHRQVGEAIERLPGADECLAELAYHFFEAGRAASIAPGPDGSALGQGEGAHDKAVSYAQRAGDRALVLLAYEEAVRLYDAGLRALDRHSSDAATPTSDEARRYELLMARGRAQRATDVAGAKRTYQQAVEVARKLGAPEALGWAVLGIADWLPLEATDGRLVTLLEEAIAAVGAAGSPLQARLLGRLATELCLSDLRGRRATLAWQALRIARQLGDAETLAHALFALHVADCGPENAAQRLAVATEMVETAEAAGSSELSLHGRVCRIVNFFELGDGSALDAEIQRFTLLAEALRQPRYLAWSAHFRAVRALSQGRFDEAERLAFEMMAQAQRGQELATESLFGGEMFALRDLQGRLDEFESAMKALVAQLESQGNSVGVRCGLAGLYSELGRAAEAKTEFEHFATDDFARLPHDGFWLNQIACLVRACAFLGDVPRAVVLYDLLQPYDGRAVALGHPGTFYDGAVAHYLGMLATTLSRWETASRHFDDSLEMSGRMAARPHVARTQYEYAAMLFSAAAHDSGAAAGASCGWAPDAVKARALLTDALATAHELGMKSLVEKAQALEDSLQRSAIRGQPAVAAVAPRPLRLGTGVFRNEGDYWTVAYGDQTLRLKNSRGVQYLAQLLHHPRREFLALDLAGVTARSTEDPAGDGARARFTGATGDTGPLLDARAKAAYTRRLGDLRDELAEAERHNDLGRAAHAREEMDLISQQLAAAMGLHGRDRRCASQAERARQTVTKGIKSAIAKIRSSNPALGHYLATTVVTGYFCAYLPDADVMISWLV